MSADDQYSAGLSSHQGAFMAHARVGYHLVPFCKPFNHLSSQLTPLVTHHLINVTMCLGAKSNTYTRKVNYKLVREAP